MKRGAHLKEKIGQPWENERHLLVAFEEKWIFKILFALANCVLQVKFRHLVFELGKNLKQFSFCFSIKSVFFH